MKRYRRHKRFRYFVQETRIIETIIHIQRQIILYGNQADDK